jgi:hypothetical protein
MLDTSKKSGCQPRPTQYHVGSRTIFGFCCQWQPLAIISELFGIQVIISDAPKERFICEFLVKTFIDTSNGGCKLKALSGEVLGLEA